VFNFINIDAWKKMEKTIVSKLGWKLVPVKCTFEIKEEHHRGPQCKSKIIVKGYICRYLA
jgi:hypothetical protein